MYIYIALIFISMYTCGVLINLSRVNMTIWDAKVYLLGTGSKFACCGIYFPYGKVYPFFAFLGGD